VMGQYGFVIKKLTDRIVEYDAALVECAVKAGVDGISFRDDYGTERDDAQRHFHKTVIFNGVTDVHDDVAYGLNGNGKQRIVPSIGSAPYLGDRMCGIHFKLNGSPRCGNLADDGFAHSWINFSLELCRVFLLRGNIPRKVEKVNKK